MSELPLNQILCGDCVEVLQEFPDNSVDLVVSDPPYGLSFMGKEWDKALPSKEAFKQMLRVLKPGAIAFVMSSPRQDLMWRMCALLEGVGFEMRQSFISWIYKTGFPKAYDVSKGIDQKLGKEREKIGLSQWYTEGRKDVMESNKNTYGDDWRTEIERRTITAPASDEARQWEGWKSITGLKPALEPILMVNKPFSEGTIVDNVLRWGTGAINVDATRIPCEPYSYPKGCGGSHGDGNIYGKAEDSMRENPYDSHSEGRFPANLLVSDGALDTGEITKNPNSYIRQSKSENINAYGKGIGELEGKLSINYGDVGDQSRYFDLDAWAQHHGLLDVPKPDTSERDYGLKGKKTAPKSKFNLNDGSKDERFDGEIPTPRRNTHPTVKPIKLMAYLIELGCPRNGVVLDPFVGSGTTCIAAKQLGRRYIGIEIKPDYHVLAEARVAAYPDPLEWFMEAQDVRE